MKFAVALSLLTQIFIASLAEARALTTTLDKIPVMGAHQEPWYWPRYEGRGKNFTARRFESIVVGRSGEQFAKDVIAANGGEEGLDKVNLRDGTILYKTDYYYVTYAEDGTTVISVMVFGEEEGLLPKYSGAGRTDGGRSSDDYLCFFKGLRAGTCGAGDAT